LVKCVRILREILGIDQQTLIRQSGVNRQALSLYENGHAFPSRRVAKRLDDAIDAILDQRALDAIESMRRIKAEPGPELSDEEAMAMGEG
jgi:transcriptional regulator with XRE-family HTH domain